MTRKMRDIMSPAPGSMELALEKDEGSALSGVSTAPPNS
jgi:hypothetical protein